MAGTQIKTPNYSLESVALFKGVPAETLGRIKQHCRCRRYESRELIIDHLDDSDEVFFLLTGNARVTIRSEDGRAVSFRELGPGATFGEYAAIDGHSRSASVEARSTCMVASIAAETFRNLILAEPTVAWSLLNYFVLEIRELTTRVYEFSTMAVRYRIQAEVLRLANLSVQQGKTARIAPIPTHAEIASRTSTHREAVTRELNRLSKLGIVEQQRRVLFIKDIDRLSALVKDAGNDPASGRGE